MLILLKVPLCHQIHVEVLLVFALFLHGHAAFFDVMSGFVRVAINTHTQVDVFSLEEIKRVDEELAFPGVVVAEDISDVWQLVDHFIIEGGQILVAYF
jgi:hypothetical protein